MSDHPQRSRFWNFDVGTLVTLLSILGAGAYWKSDVDNRILDLVRAKDVQALAITLVTDRVTAIDRDSSTATNHKISGLTTQVTAILNLMERRHEASELRIRPIETAVVQLQFVPQDLREVKAKLDKMAEQQATITARLPAPHE